MTQARRAAATILAAVLLALAAAQLATAQSLATDRQVLAPGTWRARTGQAAVIADEVRMTTGASLQAWANAQVGTVSNPRQLTITTAGQVNMDTLTTPGVYVGRFDLAANAPASSTGVVLWVTSAPLETTGSFRAQQALIARGWTTVWTRGRRGVWGPWAEHDLSTTGLTADQVAAAIAAQEGQQSSAMLQALLGVLLSRTGDTETFNVSGAVGPTHGGEDLGSRLDADDDETIRLDVQKQNSVTGAVTDTYDPILVVRSRILALTDSGSTQVLDAAGEYQEYPLRKSGAPVSQSVRVGRHGSNLVLAFGTAETAAYRITASGLGEHVPAEAVASALRSLPTGSVDGHALTDVPVSYGAALPAVATATPGALYVKETAGKGRIFWMRPAGEAPTPARNRVQIVAQAQASSGLAYGGWIDPVYDPAKSPDNYNQLLGGLQRIHVGGDNYVYAVLLRLSMLAGMGIDAEPDNAAKVHINIRGEMRSFKRFSENDPRLGQTIEVSSRGMTYVQFRTDPLTSSNAPGFVAGTTYTLLFWKASDNSAINFKPATSRAPAAWEPPEPAPVNVITTALPAITGYRLGDMMLVRGGTVGSRTWTLYVLTPNEDGDPSAWTQVS